MDLPDVRTPLPLLLLLALACSSPSPRRPAEPTAATVNGEAITIAALRGSLDAAARRDSDRMFANDDRKQAIRLGLDSLIERTLLLQAARARGVKLPEAEAERALLRLRADYPGAAFEAMLAEERTSAAALRDRLHERLTIERLLEQEVLSRVTVTPEEKEAFLAAHPELEQRPEELHAQQLVVQSEALAEKLRAELTQGASFEELARDNSLSPDAKVGGDLGFFSRGMMPPSFDEICFSLPVGKLSEVVSSPYGFHLFRVLEKRPARELSADEAMAEAEARLRKQKETAAQAAFLSALRKKAKITIDEAALARLAGST